MHLDSEKYASASYGMRSCDFPIFFGTYYGTLRYVATSDFLHIISPFGGVFLDLLL